MKVCFHTIIYEKKSCSVRCNLFVLECCSCYLSSMTSFNHKVLYCDMKGLQLDEDNFDFSTLLQ